MWFSGIIQNNFCCIRRKWVIKSCTICHCKAVASHGTCMSKKPGEVSRSQGPTWLIYNCKSRWTDFFSSHVKVDTVCVNRIIPWQRSHLIHQIRVGEIRQLPWRRRLGDAWRKWNKYLLIAAEAHRFEKTGKFPAAVTPLDGDTCNSWQVDMWDRNKKVIFPLGNL